MRKFQVQERVKGKWEPWTDDGYSLVFIKDVWHNAEIAFMKLATISSMM